MLPRDERTRSWLRERRGRLAVRGPVPALGSHEFDLLSHDNPARLVAVLIAAEAWWYEARPERIAERIADELAIADQIEAQQFATVAARVRRLANQPTHAELVRRWAS